MSGPLVAVCVTAVAGGLVALQAPINAMLADSVGRMPAATVNFFVGTLVLLALIAVVGQVRRLEDTTSVSWWIVLGGGVVGALYVTTVLITVRELGVGGVTAATVSGQLVASLVVDRFGWLGLEATPITPARVLGAGLLVAGTVLIVR